MKKQELIEEVRRRIDLTREVEDEEILETVDELLLRKGREEFITLKEKNELRKEVFNSIRRLDVLQELIEDPQITEIMINGYKNIFVEKAGAIFPWKKGFESEKRLEDIIQQIVAKTNRIVNESNPIVDTRLKDGSRVNIVLPPISLEGPVITIRKFPEKPITVEQLIQIGSVTRETAEFLKKLVQAGYNIFISGGTGSGKTTFLNVLSNYIPSDERVITIEDSAELQIRNIPNLIRLEVRNANVEGRNEVSIRQLIKTSLRMRPNRIILGEVRDEAALDLLQAMNSGHDGSLSTGHANSTADMLSRLETLVLMGADIPLMAVRQQVSSAIDIMIHLGRLRDKSRKVLEITEVLNMKGGEIQLNKLYSFEETGEDGRGKVLGNLKPTGNVLKNQDKLKAAGL
ncbi:CpaF family protein [Anaerocolumna xylanovorans]|uniref:Pilus assembly protein CpaF n=1 Tax=Anaerocolumna xylanovorans DSM 12503 TaxID=1121345 RepID=A0A1M7YMS6_9FIRM|nr:CpaF family protein [Anaerocolumna xylanovorans]SHO53867.1 pilus assembly protein CpaF [Anaerocolumna xylanovorans DSM 12503]